MKKKLKAIANHLLDLGKRNRLLNYKDTGLRTLNIYNKDIKHIFDSIVDSKAYTVFPLDAVLEKYHNDLIIDSENDKVLDYSALKVCDIATPLLKKNQLLCYKKGYTLDKTLKSIYKEYKYSINEKGINSLYMSFGFIEYLEGKEVFKAPLLLIPIELKIDKGIFKIKEYENEVILNPTLKYYMKTELNVDLPDYNDEALHSYYKLITDSLPKNTKFIDGCAIGIYSFLKMNMYNDITTNSDSVLRNNNIKALLGDQTANIDLLMENPVYPVVNYDSSQLEAIGFAANGKSFVLQGPPGSGKSQTITNIISTLMALGKHVLFVSEKLAALNVVYNNLKKAGLDEFAIELHSNKANKKDFINNLYTTAIKPKYNIDSKANDVIEKHKALKVNIKEYQREIHNPIAELGVSLYELISRALKVKALDYNYRPSNIDGFNLDDLADILKVLNEYVNYSKLLGYNYKSSPFYGFNNVRNDYLRYEFDEDFKKVIPYINKLIDLKNNLNKYIELKLVSITDIYNSLDLVDILANLKTYNSNYLIKETRDELINKLNRYFEANKNLDSNPLKNYRESLLKEDLETMLINYKANNRGLFKNRIFKELNSKILAYRSSKAKPKVIISELTSIIDYQSRLKELDLIKAFLNEKLNNIDPSEYKLALADMNKLVKFSDAKLAEDDYKNVRPYLIDILISFKSISSDNRILAKISKLFDNDIFDLYNANALEVQSKLHGIAAQKDKVAEYLLLLKTIDKLTSLKQIIYVDDYLFKGLDINYLASTYEKLFLQSKIYQYVDKSPVLNSFTSYNEDRLVEEFKKLDEEILDINRDTIISRCSMNRPDDLLLEGSKFKILSVEANKLKRQKPIRTLLEEIEELALDIKPVFLMSPLSVSTYLAGKENIFDCVIFDEASQIFSWDALGAIYRAKQCIIIGDNKQMPPSNFFGTSIEDDEEDSDLELDSILDTASLVFLTSRLRWHYRSRSEELIAFSNSNFYDEGLITIPQAKKHEKGFGIDFYYLADGRYDMKTRTNMVEAQKIYDMVFEHYKNSTQSLGVVAFSDVQARLIDDLIAKRIEKDPKLAKYFDESLDEPFFVKNLESVQGDERDKIIFSICYGYNSSDKFFQRFGPLNNLGGERRLNVAITRAKYNISVVSSIRYTDIKTDNTESLGVKMLRDYLEFIENIKNKESSSSTDDGVALSVKSYLESLGYTVYPNYGMSTFKIDLAVMKDDQFVLAIMIDKKEKYKSNTTDKKRLEALLLERLGWRYYMLYSTAWFMHNALECDRLKKALSDEAPQAIADTIEDSYLREDNSSDELQACFKSYEEIDMDLAKDYLDKYGLDYAIREIIKIEQPIHEEYLYKRAAKLLGTRVTNVLKTSVIKSLTRDINKNGSFYYVDYNYDQTLRLNSDRTIEQISRDELQNGIYSIVKKNNGITKDGCYRALISILGISRLTENTKKLLDDVVVFLKLDGLITERGESLFI